MTIDEVLKLWNKDAPIDELDLGKAALHIPKLHSKYLTLLSEAKLRRLKLHKKKKQLQVTLKEYYSGELNNPEDLKEIGREPFSLQVLNSQMQQYIDADKEMVELTLAFGYQDELVSTLEDILRSVHNRNFLIKNSIDYQRLMAGG